MAGVICTVASLALQAGSLIPGPVGAACGVGAKLVEGVSMIVGGTPIKQVGAHVFKEVVKEGVLSFTGVKLATKVTKVYGAMKGIEIAKNINKARQLQ